ncbi:MAG: AAA family ATPase [Coriobacteriales bacterium]|jgi:MoxR-like ATPase|nr:AAA family ATPase [Coriobacteriales bacterium]
MSKTQLASAKHQNCPAYDYCRAVESHGMLLANGAGCYLSNRAGNWTIDSNTCVSSRDKDAARTKAGSDQPTQNAPGDSLDDALNAQRQELTQRLLRLAADIRNQFDREAQNTEAIQTLMEAFSALFAARLRLWQSMIDATRDGRTFTDIELSFYQQAISSAGKALAEQLAKSPQTSALAALCAHDHGLKQRFSLQFDAQMVDDINSIISNITNMRPTLIVGDKGIAKTQVAKFVMGLYGSEPIVVSVKGDMMSDELIGKIKHDRVLNTFVFQEGMLLTAMRKGLPILLDEINFGDQAIIARLQEILLRRAGDTVLVQESGEESLVIQPGFAVLATANEASERYRHREILDPAIRDRFNIVMRGYPDIGSNPIAEPAPRLLRLALSSAVDRWGRASRHIDLHILEDFVRLAHATQYLYSVPAKDVVLDVTDDQLTSSVIEEGQPLMSDCVTPRALSKLVADCARGNLPGVRLDAALIEKTVRSLDQAGSTHNSLMAQQLRLLLDIGTEVARPTLTEGGAAVTEFIDLDDEGLAPGQAVEEEDAAALAAASAGAGTSTAAASNAFQGLSRRAVKAILADQLS